MSTSENMLHRSRHVHVTIHVEIHEEAIYAPNIILPSSGHMSTMCINLLVN